PGPVLARPRRPRGVVGRSGGPRVLGGLGGPLPRGGDGAAPLVALAPAGAGRHRAQPGHQRVHGFPARARARLPRCGGGRRGAALLLALRAGGRRVAARRGGSSLCRVAGDLPRSRVRRGRDGRARGRRAGAGRRETRRPRRGGARPSARVPSRAGVLRAGTTGPPQAFGRCLRAHCADRSGSMSAASSTPVALTPASLPPAGRAALRAGVVGNFIDNVHVFLPVTALAPAMLVLAGPAATASTAALIIVAMLFGRPVGGVVFGRISDRLGRTRTTRVAIAGTAACALAIAATPTHELLGGGTVALVLLLRFLCGIFVAGEYSAAIPLAMEWSPPRRRGLMSGLILSMAPWAQASIAFAVAVL